MSIRIGNRAVGPDAPPFVIAELSGNHNRSLERALDLVRAAAAAGADAVKLQTFTADTMTLDLREREFMVNESDSPWKGRSLYDLYQEAALPWEWHRQIFDLCRELGVIGFSTPFDATAVDFLESLDIPCYKIASQELVDIPLIQRVAATGKPLFLSTGMATEDEIEDALGAAVAAGGEDLVLLKCTSTYPASPEDTNIRTIPHMSDHFGVPVGLSDHTLGIGVAVAGVALGAVAVEKHFTLSRSDGGVDAGFSLEPAELAALVTESRKAHQALGIVHYGPTEHERASLRYRRSLYVVRDLAADDVITAGDIRAIRPGLGLPPKHLSRLIGKTVRRSVLAGTPVSWDLIEDR